MRSFIQTEGSHIATAEEIREFCRKDAFSAGHENGGGTPVYWDGNEMVRLSGNYHISVTGTTGSGKTMSVLLNTIYSLMEAGESLLITDPKAGELYKHSVHFARQNGYGVKVLNFSDPMRSNCYNPFSPIVQTWNKGARELSDQLLYEIADSLYSRFETSKDPFWGMTAANYFCGIGKVLRQENADLTFSSIMNLNIQGKEGVLRNRLKTWLELFDEDNYITHDLTSTIDSPKDTRLSIEAVFASPLSVYCRSGMETMMSHDDSRKG